MRSLIVIFVFYAQVSLGNSQSFVFTVKSFNQSTMSNIPWGQGRPSSFESVPKSLLRCLSEVSFTHRLAPRTNLYSLGTIVVNNDLVEDLREIFLELYSEPLFGISMVAPIHYFQWDDDQSMRSNNTSGFNYRYINGTRRLSNHSKGRAIDINPRVNPWVNNAGTRMYPANGSVDPDEPGSLVPGSSAHHLVEAFTSRGWEWGGDWNSFKDYQHFEKKIRYPGDKYCESPWE